MLNPPASSPQVQAAQSTALYSLAAAGQVILSPTVAVTSLGTQGANSQAYYGAVAAAGAPLQVISPQQLVLPPGVT